MNFELHSRLQPVSRAPALTVHELHGGDAEREWNAVFLQQWAAPLPEPSKEQLPCPVTAITSRALNT